MSILGDEQENIILVCSVSEDFSLCQLGFLLEEFCGKTNIISSICYSHSASAGSSKFYNAKVTLTSKEQTENQDTVLERPLIHSCKFEAKGTRRIFRYVERCQELSDQLDSLFKSFCFVRADHVEKEPLAFTLTFTSLPGETAISKKQFSDLCEEKLEEFFSKFSTKQFKKFSNLLERFREKQLSEIERWKKSHNTFLEWNLSNDVGEVTVTGPSDQVAAFISFLEKKCEELPFLSRAAPKSFFDHVPEDIHRSCTWSCLLETQPKLFSGNRDRYCVLVRGLPSQCNYEEVKTFFESKEVSDHGTVETVIRVNDGYLIFFQSEHSASRVLECEPYTFENSYEKNTKIVVHSKLIPPPNDKLLAIKAKLKQEEVESILESCHCVDASFDIVETAPDKFLIIFSSSQDMIEVVAELKKNLSSFSCKTQVMRLCHSDCVKISNVGDLSDDRIRVAMMKKKYKITDVKRPEKKKDSVFVFFSDDQDVPKLLEDSVKIGKVSLDISYYLVGVGSLTKKQFDNLIISKKSSSGSTAKLRPFNHDFDCKPNVTELVLKSTSVVQDLTEELVGTAVVEFSPSSSKTKLQAKFTPVILQRTSALDQEAFKRKCCMITDKYLENFDIQNLNFSAGAVRRIRKMPYDKLTQNNLLEKDGLHLLIKLTNNSKNHEKILAEVTGKPEHIKQLEKMFEEKHDVYECPEIIYNILHDCEITADVSKKHDVEISKCKGSFNLLLQGMVSDVASAKTQLDQLLEKIHPENGFSFLQNFQKTFLLDESQSFSNELQKRINDTFYKRKIKASLQLSEKTLYCKPESAAQARESLLCLVQSQSFALKDDYEDMRSDPQWKETNSFLGNLKFVEAYVEDSILTLVGLDPNFTEAKTQVQAYLSLADETTLMVKTEKIQKEYIQLFSNKTAAGSLLNNIDWYPVDEGIHLHGKQRHVKEAKAILEKACESLVITKHNVEMAWQIKYINSEAGKQLLKIVQSENECVIVVEKEKQRQETFPAAISKQKLNFHGNSVGKPFINLSSVRLPDSDVVINVVQDDITCHKSDAIVNASNKELELRPAGVSGSILRKGGRIIQEEMRAYTFSLKSGKLETGKAVTTGAGNLRNCRKIIHVAGPVWYEYAFDSSKPAKKLKESVWSCLHEAERHRLRSIAIPAISCGVFGGKPDQSAKLIMEAVVEFFADKTKRYFVTKVDLIELSNRDVINAFRLQLGILQTNAPSMQKLKDTKSGKFYASKNASSSIQSASASNNSLSTLNVIVEKGNILKCSDDVIINTAGPRFDLTASKLSKMLLQEGGYEIDEECRKNGFECKKQYLFTKSGRLLCKYIAHLIVPSDDITALPSDLLDIFKEVDKRGLSSVALPAIGTGIAAFNERTAVWVIQSAIGMFQDYDRKHLNTIKIVLYEERLFSTFQALSTGRKRSVQSSEEKLSSSYHKTPPHDDLKNLNFELQSVEESKETLKPTDQVKSSATSLKICSKSTSKNEEAYKKLQWKLEKKFKERTLSNVPLDVDIDNRLNDLKSKYTVSIRIENTTHGRGIEISGLQDDVNAAKVEIDNFLRENSIKALKKTHTANNV